MMQNSFFIVLEGIDGSGKTTQLTKIDHWLTAIQEKHLVTKEPTDTEIGSFIRRSIQGTEGRYSPFAQLFLFSADRVEHAYWIKEHLDRGTHILCDRFSDSTFAYQAITPSMEVMIAMIQACVEKIVFPAFTFFIDTPVEVAFDRIKKRTQKDCFEEYEFLFQVRQRYLKLIAKNPDRYVIINGNNPCEEVFSDIKKVLLNAMEVS